MFKFLLRLVFILPPEMAHNVSLHTLSLLESIGLLRFIKPKVVSNPVTVMGIEFPNRVGLAAGLDKNGQHINALSQLGFGFIEIGTVTPRPQPGNPKPRLFRISKAKGIINRMGFNNKGSDQLIENLNSARGKGYDGVIGINIGKNFDTPVENALDDYVIGLRQAYKYADYITVNISSPNTPGLRSLQYGKELNKLLSEIKNEQIKLSSEFKKYIPIAIKVAPDLSDDEIEDIATSLLDNQLDALIATNTTLSRDAVEGMPNGKQKGGLSGEPVREMSTEVIRKFHQRLGDHIPIIGVGGISSREHAQEKLEAGASLVQIYSGLIYQGPKLIKQCMDV